MSELIRILSHHQQNNRYVTCGWWSADEPDCQRLPVLRLATPHGHQDYCDEHIDYVIASLPREWLDGFAYREPVLIDSGNDIPF